MLGHLVLIPGNLFSQSPGTQLQIFKEISTESQLVFRHDNGMSGEFFLPEITGSGVALLDFDNDGDLDVYLVQGGLLKPDDEVPNKFDRFFRNDLTIEDDGNRRILFEDVTEKTGILSSGYGMGVATGDYNNDGWVDLYVTNVGPNRLYMNNGNGTFSDVTKESGTDDPRWSTSASFVDINQDGWLDLFLTNYVDFTEAGNRVCYAADSSTDYCGPDAYGPEGDSFFLNLGNGSFEDITSKSKIYEDFGAGLGVVTADFNGDGWIDIYVANDGDPNLLWLNQQDNTFLNDALLAGVALNNMGSPEASMGVDAADYDEDGDMDLFMTHIMEETNTLYQNDGEGLFEDRTIEVKLAMASLQRTAFGTTWIDFDNDGWLDLVILNGAVRVIGDLARQGDPYPLHQPNQLFRNDSSGGFVEVTDLGGEVFNLSEVSRGVAAGDIDNDGDTDLVISNSHGPVRLLQNQLGNQNNWIGLRLRNAVLKRDMLGSRVELVTDEGDTHHRVVRTDGSYCSARDSRVLVGLGTSQNVSILRVIWPDGDTSEWENLRANRYYDLIQGIDQWKVIQGTEQSRIAAKTNRHLDILASTEDSIDKPSAGIQSGKKWEGRILSTNRDDLVEVPLPDLEILETAVHQQLAEIEQYLRSLLENKDRSDDHLGLSFGKAAEVFHTYEMYLTAESCYKNAVFLQSKEFRWPYMIGLLYHAQGRFKNSLDQYAIAREIKPDYSPLLINMGDAFINLNQLDTAEKLLEEALQLGTNNPAASFGLGRIELKRHHYEKAVKLIESALTSVPQANRLHHSLAMAYRGMGQMEKAHHHIQQLGPIGLRPVDPYFEHLQTLMRGERSHLLRGRKAYAAGDYQMASIEFKKAVDAEPKSIRSRVNLAASLVKLARVSEAILEFEKALEIDPGNQTAHYNLGVLFSDRKNFTQAVEHFRIVVSINSRDSEAHYLLARALNRSGDVENALKHYQSAINHDRNSEDAILERTELLSRTGNFEASISELLEANSRLPHQGRIAHSLARLLASSPIKELRSGTKALELALRVYKARSTVTHAETVAMALAELGRCEEAVKWQEGAIRGARDAGLMSEVERLSTVLMKYQSNDGCRP